MSLFDVLHYVALAGGLAMFGLISLFVFLFIWMNFTGPVKPIE